MSKIPTHKVVFIQDHYQIKDPKTGLLYTPNTSTLYIRSYQPKNKEKQHRKVSLKIKLKNTDIKAYFDERKQRFKDIKKFPEGQDYNEKIEDELRKLGIYDDLSYIPDRRKSFLKYWQSVINTTTNHGTRIKQDGVKTKLEKYLNGWPATRVQDLCFSEITPDLLRSVYHYFKTAKDPKQLTIATANHYMKIIHGVINTAAADMYYNYDVDPFVSLKYNKADAPLLEGKVVNHFDLKTILRDAEQPTGGPVDENGKGGSEQLPEHLEKYRLALLFQLFSNGMRVSDMLLLRWSNLESGSLKYSMFKTKKSMMVPMNINLINIVCRIIDDGGEMLNMLNRMRTQTKPTYIVIDGEKQKVTLELLNKKIESITTPTAINSESLKKDLKSRGYLEVDGYYVDPKNLTNYYILTNAKDYLLASIEKVMMQNMWMMNSERKNDFLFPFLSNDDFSNIGSGNNFNNITESQYKMIKHKTIVYNRNLKKIAEFYRFDKSVNLTSHVARHSFASYLLSMGNVNTFDIQKLLGHQSIQITDKYLQKHFNTEKLEGTNRRLSRENIMK